MNQSLTELLKLVAQEDHGNLLAIDVGAHHGEYSQYLMNRGLFKQVISFEPSPASYQILLNNMSQLKNCKFNAINMALSNHEGILELYSDEATATASLLQYQSAYVNQGQVNIHKVPVTALDDYLAKHPYEGRLQLLKIDTQGHDLAVIQGAKNTIAKHRPIIQTEFIYTAMYAGQCSSTAITELLNGSDYELYSLNNLHNTIEGRLAFCDAVFIPKELKVPSSQEYVCIDNQALLETLSQACEERLVLIDRLSAEIDHLRLNNGAIFSIFRKIKGWLM